MLLFKIVTFVIIATILFTLLFKNLNKWSIRFQRHAVSQMMRVFGDAEGWDDPWAKYFSMVIVVFLGLMLIIGIYVAIFSI